MRELYKLLYVLATGFPAFAPGHLRPREPDPMHHAPSRQPAQGVGVAPTFPTPKRLHAPRQGEPGTPPAAQSRGRESSTSEGNPPTPRRRHRHQEIDMHQNFHTQQHEAPLSIWIAAGIAALAYLTALHFATYATLTGTVAVVAAVSAVRWLRSSR